MLSDEDYIRLASHELGSLIAALDEVDHPDLDAELENDIITLELPSGPPYVINSHRAARQIWMAAERRAWHFDHDAARQAWVSDKGGDELWAVITQVLQGKLGDFPKLQRRGMRESAGTP